MDSNVRLVILALALSIVGANGAQAVTPIAISFQNGVDGYGGASDRRIGPTFSADGTLVDTDVASFFLDGGSSDLNDSGARHGLLRFDNIIGGAGLPAGAKILSATVDVVTTDFADSQTSAAFNVYQLTTPFDQTSTWADTYGGDGILGDVGPILGSFDGLDTIGSASSARVDKAVQAWVEGAANHGFGIRSDRSTNGWSPHTTGSATIAKRPRLSVQYTLDPLVDIRSYQQGVNGYVNGLDKSFNPDTDTSAVSEVFIDGPRFENQVAAENIDQPYLVRFGGIDLNYQEIHKAELVLKTGFASGSADSPGPITVHQMLTDWSEATAYADFETNGDPTRNDVLELLAAGTIAPAAATVTSANDTAVVHIDITSIVENWRAGQPNYGIYLGTEGASDEFGDEQGTLRTGTANGWQIFVNGAADASFRPELRIIGVAVPEPSTLVLLGLSCALLAVRRSRD